MNCKGHVRELGQGMVEYALILGLISVVAIGSLNSIGVGVGGTLDNLVAELDGVVDGNGLAGEDGGEEVEKEQLELVGDFKLGDRGALEYIGKRDVDHVVIPTHVYEKDGKLYAPKDRGVPKKDVLYHLGDDEVVKLDSVGSLEDLFNSGNLKGTVKVELAEGNNVEVMEAMFANCGDLTGLDLSNFNTSNVTNMKGMFRYCNKLESIEGLDNFRTSKVTTFSWMFWECSSLKEIDLSSFKTGNVEHLSSMFNACSSLETLDLRSFDTSNVEDMQLMFEDCSHLKSLDLSSFDTSKVTYMQGMFKECSNIIELKLGTEFKAKEGVKTEGIVDGASAEVTRKLKDKGII